MSLHLRLHVPAPRLSILLALAAVALVVFWGTPARAQVIGYVYVTMTNGYNFVANPLNARNGLVTDNSLTNVLRRVPDGTRVYTWDPTNQTFNPGATYLTNRPGWDMNFDLPPGKGFVLWANGRWTNLFLGAVPTGTFSTPVFGSHKFSLVASAIYLTQPGSLSTLQFPTADGENVYVHKAASQAYADAVTWFSGWGWYDPAGVVDVNGPVISSGQSFFVQRPGSNTSWVQSYNTGTGLAAAKLAGTTGVSIGSIVAGANSVTLEVANPAGQSYSVQFSADGSVWNTVAAAQTGARWTGPLSAGGQGFYRLTQP